MKHLNIQLLIQYLENDLDAAERKKVETHMDVCTDCQHELDVTRRMLARMREDELVAPPTNLVGRVVTAFRRKKARAGERPLRQATLQFDSWTQMALMGVRGTPQEHQLLFSEGAFDLDLQVVKDTTVNTFVLRGQILGNESQQGGLEGIELHIADADGVERRGLTDQLGRFCFSQLAGGTYSLKIILDEHDIVLDSIAVTDNRASQDET